MQKMRVIARIAGFRISKINLLRINKTSLFLFPFYYPFIFLSSYFTYFKALKKEPGGRDPAKKEATYKEQLRLNLNPIVLLFGHA